MKKIIISMFLIMAAGILVSCGKSKEEMDSYLVYYLNQDMTGLVEGIKTASDYGGGCQLKESD